VHGGALIPGGLVVFEKFVVFVHDNLTAEDAESAEKKN